MSETIMTNREYAEKCARFVELCSLYGIKPTTRQASKYRNGKGIVYKKANGKL